MRKYKKYIKNLWLEKKQYCFANISTTKARIFMKFKTKAHKIMIDHHIKFCEDRSFRCGDIWKTILGFFNCWFSMYFLYFLNYAPPKASYMDNYWIIMNFFWDYISKCTYLMNKKKPVSIYRLFSSLSNKQIILTVSKKHPVALESIPLKACACPVHDVCQIWSNLVNLSSNFLKGIIFFSFQF